MSFQQSTHLRYSRSHSWFILGFISRMNGLEDTLKRNHFKSYGIESFPLETNSRTLMLDYSQQFTLSRLLLYGYQYENVLGIFYFIFYFVFYFILLYSSFSTWLEDTAKCNALPVNTKAGTFRWSAVGVPFKCFHVGVRHYKDWKGNRNGMKWIGLNATEKIITLKCLLLDVRCGIHFWHSFHA